MTDVMQGIRILEVAEHTFVPAASAILADWGAEVIKIEHVERGDAMRGLVSSGIMHDAQRRARAPRALQPGQAEPRPRPHHRPTASTILYRLAATCDVFLTNKLPGRAHKLHIDVDDIRAAQPGHRLRARHGAGRARPRGRQGRLRLPRLLVPVRRGRSGAHRPEDETS